MNIKKKMISLVLSAALAVGFVPAVPMGAAEQEDACTIRIVHTNDIHGYYKATNWGTLGFAKLKTLIDTQEPGLVLDVGDIFHGQSFATVGEGGGIAELMKSIGYDAMTPGNHDWNYGSERLKELGEDADVPILAGNIHDAEGEDYFGTPYICKDVTADNGEVLRIGVLGVMDDSLTSAIRADYIAGLTVEEESADASNTAQMLREDEGCDVVVALTHQAYCEDFVKGTEGIDVVLAGHEHRKINEIYKDAGGRDVPVFEAGCYFENIGMVSLTVDTENKTVSAEETVFDAGSMSEIAEDADMAEQMGQIEEAQKEILDETVGTSEEDYGYSWEEIRADEQKIGRIITAAYLEETGADVAFENSGAIRAGIKKGDITVGNIISISPYGNTLLTKELTGQQILGVLEKSIALMLENRDAYEKQKEAAEAGMEYEEYCKLYPFPNESGNVLQAGGISVWYNPEKDGGNRIIRAEIGDEPVDAEKTYVVAANNFVGCSCDQYPEIVEEPVLKDYGTCEEALRDYFKTDKYREAAEKANLVKTEESGTDPTAAPTADPTADPTAAPTVAPTADPTAAPTVAPTADPTAAPTTNPTAAAPSASPEGTSEPGGEEDAVVKPAKVKVTKAVVKKKKLTVNAGKVKNADGYQVQAASDKKFSKNKKSWNTKKLPLTGKPWKKKAGYVRVRAYIKKDGGTVYGKWSDVKKMKGNG